MKELLVRIRLLNKGKRIKLIARRGFSNDDYKAVQRTLSKHRIDYISGLQDS